MKTKNASTKKERKLSIFDMVMITASGVRTARSIFVIATLAIASAGGRSLISFLITAFITANIALCYAELWATHPSAGGEYSIIKRLFGASWLATIIFCVSSALLAYCSNLVERTSFTVILLLFIYIIMAIATLFSRNRDIYHLYKMPLWPIPSIITLAACLYVLWSIDISSKITEFNIIAAIIVVGIFLNTKHRKKQLIQPYDRLKENNNEITIA